MTMDTLIITLCVAAAVAFIGTKVYRAVTGSGGCGCGCRCSRVSGASTPADGSCRGCSGEQRPR